MPKSGGGETVDIYTDGACPKNGCGAQVGGVGVYFGEDDPRNISEKVQGDPVTNNQVELLALVRALEYIALHKDGAYQIFTDSIYGMKVCTEWRHGWKKRGWKKADGKPVLNLLLVQQLDKLMQACEKWVTFIHVRGHQGIPGNEAADQLAVKACR
jgi:ribonuclease HI